MPISVGNVLDKISETRSKIAILEGVVLHLRSNYHTSDAGEPEMRFYRGDYAPVPEAHISSTIVDLEALVKECRAQLEQWEGIVVDVDEVPSGGGPGNGGKKTKKPKEATATDGR